MCVNMCVNMCMDMSTHAHRHVAIAEENSNKVLLAARSMELTETELNVYEALAKNPDVVVSDSTEKDFNLMLLADSVLGGTKKGGATSHQAILLETIQLPGKKPLPVQDILNGRADWFSLGTVLS